jgi:hypothetical protein
MASTMRQDKEFYTEQEAAEELGISLQRLQYLLDEHVFSDGLTRPPELTLQSTDLVLLELLHKQQPTNVFRMPRRRV